MDNELLQRCKHYGTTLSSCSCPGFTFRKTCKHIRFLVEYQNIKLKSIHINDGDDAVMLCEQYGNDIIENMKRIGEVYEVKGKLYIFK